MPHHDMVQGLIIVFLGTKINERIRDLDTHPTRGPSYHDPDQKETPFT